MSLYHANLIAKVRLLWKLTTLFVGLTVTLVIHARGELFQAGNIPSSILTSLCGILVVTTLLFLADILRQKEYEKLRSIRFRSFMVLALFSLYGTFFLAKPEINFIDLVLLFTQAFIFSAFIHALISKIGLDNHSLTLYSLTGTSRISWKTISSIRWVDKGTIAVLAAEYPKEIIIPLFTFTKRAEILHYFQTCLDKQNSNIDFFLRELSKRK